MRHLAPSINTAKVIYQRDNFESMLRDLGFHPTRAELDRLFLAIDRDDNGSIELREFENWVQKKATSDSSDNWKDLHAHAQFQSHLRASRGNVKLL